MPIIFAQSLMIFPRHAASAGSAGMIAGEPAGSHGTSEFLNDEFSRGGFLYIMTEVVDDLLLRLLLDDRAVPAQGNGQPASRLRQLHPRPASGQAHADYLEKVMMRITYVGAAFLCVIAVIPTAVSTQLDIPFQIAAVPGRHRPADRGERRAGHGPAHRSQPADAQLRRLPLRPRGRRARGSREGSTRLSCRVQWFSGSAFGFS